MNNVRRIKIINISQDGGSQLKLRYYYPVATSSISVCVSKVNNTLFNFNGVTLLLFFVANIHSLSFFHFHFVLNKVAILVKVIDDGTRIFLHTSNLGFKKQRSFQKHFRTGLDEEEEMVLFEDGQLNVP